MERPVQCRPVALLFGAGILLGMKQGLELLTLKNIFTRIKYAENLA